MRIEPYTVAECHFAYCYHVYLRWSTHRRRSYPVLSGFSAEEAQEQAQEYGIELLEWHAAETEVRVLASLRPDEAVAACAGKLKGRTSKWLREELKLAQPTSLLSKGYFACTSGKSDQATLDRYLDRQVSITATPTALSRLCMSAVSTMPTRITSAPSTPLRCYVSIWFWAHGAGAACSRKRRLRPSPQAGGQASEKDSSAS